MSGNDREPIGRKGKASKPPRNVTRRGRRREPEDDIDQDDFDEDDEESAPVPPKGKGKRPARGKRRWLGWLIKLFPGVCRGDGRLGRLSRFGNPQPH